MQSFVSSFRSIPTYATNIPKWWCHHDKRHLFRWLTIVWNNVDKEQIKQFGPEVAAAQWLLRNGAKFKWSKNNGLFDDYSKLVSDSSLQKDHIVEIDATESSITHVGFPYLKNLNSLKKITFNETKYLEDKALVLLGEYQLPSLKHLEVIQCHDITDHGVLSLQALKSLEYLKLEGLSSVQNKSSCYEVLSKEMVKCKIDWN